MNRRTPQTEESYQKRRGENTPCPFCAEDSLYSWEAWKIVKNEFPYDNLAEKHDILTLKAHERDMNNKEYSELKEIKKLKFIGEYDCILENLPHSQSVPEHFHLHLIRWKRGK